MLRISQVPSITGTSPSDYLVSYTGHSLWGGESYPSAEVQSVYSTAPTDWANYLMYKHGYIHTHTYAHTHKHTTQIHMHTFTHSHISKLADRSRGDLKAPFSIATPPRRRGGCNSFPWIAPLTLYPHIIMLSFKQGIIKYLFLCLLYDSTWDWTLISRAYIYIYICAQNPSHAYTRDVKSWTRLFQLAKCPWQDKNPSPIQLWINKRANWTL